MKYEGKLYWDGSKPLIQTRDQFIKWLSQFPEDQWFSFNVTPLGVKASDQQKLYFKWRDILAEEFGWDNIKMHDYLKNTYNDGKSTKGLDTAGWSEFMSKVLALAGSYNITLPLGYDES
jgi:hypothetical protein